MKQLALLTTALLLVTGVPQAEAQVSNLDQLLRLVEQGRAADNREAQQREQRFRAAQGEQQRLLNESRAERTRQERRSEQLENTFEANELSITEVSAQLDERLGSLKELFGVLQQVSGDAQGNFANSLTSIEFPDRGEFLVDLAQKMGSSTQLASIEEIERLWFELQREATETGKVKVIPGYTVVTANGEQETRDVVRVGAFNLASDGKYLQVVDGVVSELQRQPQQGRFTGSTSDLLGAQDGFEDFGIDITRGQLLSLEVEKPSLIERVQQGGLVGYVIIALGLIGLLIALERLVTLSIAGGKVSAQLKSDTPSENNALGRVLKVYHNNRSVDTETLELKLGEAILKETPALQRSLLFLKIISVVAPLMGLLGTVTGMIKTFQAITLFGTGDPKMMAGGISQALVTTVLGLVVAIPTVLLHTLVSGRSKRIVQVLQEQSAGIVAEHSEKH